MEGWRGVFQRRIAELSDVKNASKTRDSPRWANKILEPLPENPTFSGWQEILNRFFLLAGIPAFALLSHRIPSGRPIVCNCFFYLQSMQCSLQNPGFLKSSSPLSYDFPVALLAIPCMLFLYDIRPSMHPGVKCSLWKSCPIRFATHVVIL